MFTSTLRLRRLVPALLAAAAAVVVACEQLQVVAVDVDEISVTPDPVLVQVGGTVQAAAHLVDADGNVLGGRSITWSSDSPSIAEVDANGLVTGMAAGTTRITAQAEGRSGSATVTVGGSLVASVDVQPAAATLGVGETRQLTATPRDAGGVAVVGRAVSWASDAPGIATVSASGLVTAVATGSATIRATVDGQIGTATITVQRAPVASVTIVPSAAAVVVGGTLPLGVELRSATGELLTGRTVNWSSSNTSVATVDATGVVHGIAAGTVTITASSEGRSGTATVDVESRPVASVTINPAAASVTAGQTVQLSAVLRAADDAVLTGRAVTWTSDAPATATVNENGLVTGVNVGIANIRATAEGISATAVVNVTQKPVATVTVSPGSAGLRVGGTVQLTATLRASDGSTLTGRKVTWSSSKTGVATVDTMGLVTAVDTGTVTITATSESRTGTATITVSLRPVASVTVAPPSANLIVGGTVQLTATLRDSANAVITGRVVAWSSGNTAVATVDAGTGLVTAVGPGTTTITATSEGKTGTSTITVAPKPVATVTLAPASSNIFVGDTLRITATLRAADGTVLTGRPVAWSSSNPLIAGVDNTGKVTALLPGTVTITATSTAENVSGTASVTVTLKPVASVTILPANPSVLVGATAQLTAELRAADNTLLTGRPVAWTSSDPTVATVNQATGLVTGLKAGTTVITATSEGIAAQATLTVSNQPVATVVVTPLSANMFVGDHLQLTAQTFDANNNLLTGRTITWSVGGGSNDASVTGGGLVTALSPGTVQVVATSEGKSGSATITITFEPVATVTVTPNPGSVVAGAALQMSAVLRAADNGVITGRTITWSTSNASVATINSSTGLVTGVAVGQVTVTATVETTPGSGTTVVGNATVNVTPQPVSTVTVSPNPGSVVAGATLQMSAVLRAADNTVLTGRTVTWSTSNGAIATVDPTTGLATGVAAGQVTITATVETTPGSGTTVSGAATLNVTAKPVSTVTVTPNPGSVVAGSTLPMSAVLRAADNSVITGRTVTWSTSNAGVASIDPASGVVTGVMAGQVTITAMVETTPGSGVMVSGTAIVNVTPKPVSTVTVTPNPGSVAAGSTLQMSATLRAADNSVITGRVITWSTSNAGVASIDPATGVVSGVATGQVTITATVETTPGSGVTVSGNATVNVTPVPVNSVTVTPDPGTVQAGSTLAMTAVLRAADNSVITGRTVTWSSSDPATASINPSTGLVTGVAAGQVTITAQAETTPGSGTFVAGTATVDVTPQSVSTVTVSPDPGSVVEDGTLQMSATLRAADNSVITGRTVTWSSSNAAIASINPSTGLVTGVAAGQVTITAQAETTPGSGTFVAGTATVNVTLKPVSTVTVSPDPGSVVEDATLQMSATLRAANNSVITGRTVTWSSSNAGIASIDPSTGLVTGVAAGQVTITAQVETTPGSGTFVSGTATVNVTLKPVSMVTVTPDPGAVEEGAMLQMSATLQAADNSVITGRAVGWSTSDASIASIDAATGLVTGVLSGQATVTAQVETTPGSGTFVSGTATVNVATVPVNTVTVSPDPGAVAEGSTLQMTATLRATDNSVITGRTIDWSSSDAAIASIDPSTGLVTGVAAGQVTITAQVETTPGSGSFVSGTATVDVTLEPVSTVTVSPDPGAVDVGSTLQMSATLQAADNSVITGRTVDWSTSDAAVASIDAVTGLVTGAAAGQVTITAQVETTPGSGTFVSGTATVDVNVPPAPVDSVVVTDDATPPAPGATVQLTATVWAGGVVVTDRPVTWSGGTAGIATIDANGLVTIDPSATTGQQASFTATADGVASTPFVITVQ